MPGAPLFGKSKYSFLDAASKPELGLLYTTILEHVGYFTTPGKSVGGDGVDYVLYRPDGSEPEAALHCRPGRHPVVGLSDVRRLWESITAGGYARAIFVTNSHFSPSAKEYCGERDYVMIDAGDLESGLDEFSPEERLRIFRTYEAKRSRHDASYFGEEIRELEEGLWE